MKNNNKKRFIIIVIILGILGGIIACLNYNPLEKYLHDDISKLNYNITEGNSQIITEHDIKDFPVPVKKFLRKNGVIGAQRIYNARIAFDGIFRMGKDKPWLNIETVQFNYLPEPTRIFHIKGVMFGIISMAGKDTFENGKGGMKGKLMKLITIFDEKGKEFDISELITFLNDTVLLYPAGLITIKDRLKWNEIDKSSVEVALYYQDLTVKAKLYFNEKGDLINFTTTDRFMDEKDETGKTRYVKTMWSTPVIAYKVVNGQKIVSEAEALWHPKTGKYSYARFVLKNIEYNIKE